MAAVIRKTVRARDIPPSWNVHLPGDPDAPVTVVIMPGSGDAGDARPLTSFLGAGRGVFGSPEEADRYIRESRDAWEE